MAKNCVGISEARARWLADWSENTVKAGYVVIDDLVAVLGRFSFAMAPSSSYALSWHPSSLGLQRLGVRAAWFCHGQSRSSYISWQSRFEVKADCTK